MADINYAVRIFSLMKWKMLNTRTFGIRLPLTVGYRCHRMLID